MNRLWRDKRVAMTTKAKSMARNKPKVAVRKVGWYLSPTYDFIAKGILGAIHNLKNITIPFLMSVLDIPEGEYINLRVVNPEMPKRTVDGKFVVLDILLETTSHGTIHIEIQVKPIPHPWERLVEYSALNFASQLYGGDDYEYVKRVISILIYTDGIMIDKDDHFFHCGRIHDRFTKEELTALEEHNIIELKKLDKASEEEMKSALYKWARFFNAKTETELEAVAKEDPAIADAFEVLKVLSEDKNMQKMAEVTERNRRYIADQLWGAEQKGIGIGEQRGAEKTAINTIKLLNLTDPDMVVSIGEGAITRQRAVELIRQYAQK
ncbi:hypothetical protein FACS1894184_18670 [Clostridia bacterium]|nr:hypothetical protein FACS1894184_18670 [Clostridia bacterium]